MTNQDENRCLPAVGNHPTDGSTARAEDPVNSDEVEVPSVQETRALDSTLPPAMPGHERNEVRPPYVRSQSCQQRVIRETAQRLRFIAATFDWDYVQRRIHRFFQDAFRALAFCYIGAALIPDDEVEEIGYDLRVIGDGFVREYHWIEIVFQNRWWRPNRDDENNNN